MRPKGLEFVWIHLQSLRHINWFRHRWIHFYVDRWTSTNWFGQVLYAGGSSGQNGKSVGFEEAKEETEEEAKAARRKSSLLALEERAKAQAASSQFHAPGQDDDDAMPTTDDVARVRRLAIANVPIFC